MNEINWKCPNCSAEFAAIPIIDSIQFRTRGDNRTEIVVSLGDVAFDHTDCPGRRHFAQDQF